VEADLFVLSNPSKHTTIHHRITNATALELSKLLPLYAFSKGVGVAQFYYNVRGGGGFQTLRGGTQH